MKFSTTNALILVCFAMCINILCVDVAGADSVTYVYRGNNFVELQGEPGIFSTKDRVTGQFTLDCSAAHIEGTCANLPFDNYFTLGAVELEPLSFSAGPAELPTADGNVEISAFFFSTDSNGHIVDWNIDLYLDDPSGVINVDTDNDLSGPIDSAAALGGDAVVFDNPGKWKIAMSPVQAQGQPSCPCFTSDTIDAAALSLWGVLQDDSRDPIAASGENECTGPEGTGIERLETEFRIFTTSRATRSPLSQLYVETGFVGERTGTCVIRIDRDNDQAVYAHFMFKVGGRGVAGVEDELTVNQVASCQKEILKSNTWRHFCPDILDQNGDEEEE